MKLTSKRAAVIYEYESGDTYYRITCVEGEVLSIQKIEVQYYDCGDAENGPKVGSELSDPMELTPSHDWFEADLEDSLEEMLKDAEAYTIHLMMSEADYSKM